MSTTTLSHANSNVSISSATLSPSINSSSSTFQQAQSNADFIKLEPIRLSTHQASIAGSNVNQSTVSYETLSDLYSLLLCCEHCETAYIRDSLSADRYTQLSSRLIAQFRTIRDTLDSDVGTSSKGAQTTFDFESFSRQYSLSCRAALNRFKLGVPATVIHGDNSHSASSSAMSASSSSSSDSSSPSGPLVLHITQHFITAMDALKLSYRAVDELQPSINEIMDSLNKCTTLAYDHECKVKIRQWLITLSSMKASQQITEDQARQMSFELESAYNAFHKFLQQQGKPV